MTDHIQSLDVNSNSPNPDTYSTSFYIPIGASEISLSWNLSLINYDDQISASVVDANNVYQFYKSSISLNGSMAINDLVPDHNYKLYIGRGNTSDVGSVSITWKASSTTSTTYEKIIIGGLRIKAIRNYTAENIQATAKNYNYNKFNTPNRSSASISQPVQKYVTDYEARSSVAMGPSWPPCSYYVLSSSSAPETNNGLNPQIGYAQVTATETGATDNGRTRYQYSIGGLEFGLVTNYDWAGGQLLEKSVEKFVPASQSYKLVTKTRNFYYAAFNAECFGNSAACSPSQVLIPNWRISLIRQQFTDNSDVAAPTYPAIFLVEKYYTSSAQVQLVKSEDITYNDHTPADSVVAYKDYFYANSNYSSPTKIESLDSKGALLRQEFKYPPDLALAPGSGANVYNYMVERNIIAPVIELKLTDVTNSVEIGKKITSYSGWNNNVNLKPAIEQSSFNGGALHTDIQYQRYDVNGNLLSVSKSAGAPVHYLWSYAGTYPVAEIRNASYAAIENILGVGAIELFSNQLSPDKAAVDSFLAPLKANLPDAFITSYSFKPLIGMVSQTDPKGITMYYEYDALGRLKLIKDQSGAIVKANTYHYQP